MLYTQTEETSNEYTNDHEREIEREIENKLSSERKSKIMTMEEARVIRPPEIVRL